MPGSMLKHVDSMCSEKSTNESPLQDYILPTRDSKKPVSIAGSEFVPHDRGKTQIQSPIAISTANQDRLLNAREVAAKLGVSERWVRDHTTRRSPKIRAVKLGWLIRYRRADVDSFMEHLDTLRSSRNASFGV